MGPLSGLTEWLISELPAPALVLEVISKGTLILVLALGLCSLRRRSSATQRHLVFVLAIIVNLMLPALVTTVPSWDLPRLLPFETGWPIEIKALSIPLEGAGAVMQDLGPGLSIASSPQTRPTHWLGWLWLAGTVLVSLRLLIGLGIVYRILKSSRPVTDPGMLAVARRCRRQLRLSRDVQIVTSPRAAVAFTWGCFRPRIILPEEAISWPLPKSRIVLFHEMAHVKRWDALATGLAQAAVILYWFNPLLWLTQRRLLAEREQASDDLVLSMGVPASSYAACLIEIARSLQGKRWLPELQIAISRKFQLEKRIKLIIMGSGRRSAPCQGGSFRHGLVVVLLLALMIPLASWRIFAQNEAALTNENRSFAPASTNITAAEGREIDVFLDRFYNALGNGDDFETVQKRFLTKDYFDDPARTFEMWPQERRDRLMHNTLTRICRLWCDEELPNGVELHGRRVLADSVIKSEDPFGIKYKAEVISCRKVGGEYHLDQRVDIVAQGRGSRPQPLVKNLIHTIVFTREDGALKIRSYDGGIAVRRMDVNNPYGPIFIVTIEANEEHAPAGPLLFKSIPRSIVKNGANMIPLHAQPSDS